MVLVKDIAEKIENKAPVYLKESYDNVGLMVGDKNAEIKKVLLALDCTLDVADEAVSKKCELIVTHHPLFFRKPSRIVKGDLTGDKVIKLIKNNISLYSCHTNLDSAENGINKRIVEMLGFESSEIIEKSSYSSSCGIGRIIRLDKKIEFDEIIQRIKNNLKIENLRAAEGNREIRNIAVINGSGQDFFAEAEKRGADCIITGDTTYHFVSDYKEKGISIIDAGHFGTEYLVFLDTLKFLKDEFKEVEFIYSEKSQSPYKFY